MDNAQNSNGPIESVLSVFKKGAAAVGEFKTIADDFIDDWGLRPEKRVGAAVPGRPVAPAIYDYPSQWSKESLDRSIKDVRTTVSGLGKQIKGLFNLAYESPTGGQTAQRLPSPVDSLGVSPLLILALLALVFLKR